MGIRFSKGIKRVIFVYHHIVLIAVIAVFLILVIPGLVILEAVIDFYNRPKEEMFWCFKHGYFRKKHALPLFPDMGGTAENSYVCPTCYRDIVFTTPDKKMKAN
jgi:hypothetical protein